MATVKDAAGLVVNYSYRAGGELKSLSRPGSTANSVISTSMEYDTLGRKISMIDPDKGSYNYSYNAVGELVQERSTDANATCATLTYDRLGRKRTRQDFANSSCSGVVEHSAAWTFDSTSYGLGQLASETAATRSNTTVTRNFLFDSFGRPASSKTTMGGVTYQSRAVFDHYSRPFQSFFKASSDALIETGEYFEYDNLGIGVATRDANGGTNGTVYSASN